jgi:hypothetical protein
MCRGWNHGTDNGIWSMVERWKSKKTGDAKLASAMFLGLPSARLACRSFRTGLWHARGRWIPLRRPPTLRGCNCKSNRPGTQTSFLLADTAPSRYQGSPRPRGEGHSRAVQPLLMADFSLLLTCAHAAVVAGLSQIMLHHLPFSGSKPFKP